MTETYLSPGAWALVGLAAVAMLLVGVVAVNVRVGR